MGIDLHKEEEIRRRVVLLDLLQFLVNNPLVHSTLLKNLQHVEYIYYGVFELDNYHFQIGTIRDDNDNFLSNELIIVDNSDGNKKMTVLTADGIESELIEMDSSGMKENEIIDLNVEGRRWEGGELSGKPFGFGFEYSEEGNLVYEGFVFEGKKICYGKEWNDDGNNNCLMYEGGYWNDERCGKGISYDLNGNVDYEGEWMNNHGITENENDCEE